MRAQRQKVKLLEEGKADEDDIMINRAKYQGQLYEYTVFSRKMGLMQERERIYIDNLGRVAPYKRSDVDKYTHDMIRNAERDKQQFNRYKKELGNNIGSLADFRQMKYNEDSWESFKSYVNSIRIGELTPLVNFELYQKMGKEIDDKLIGQTTCNEIIITGKSKHFIARAIGSIEQRRNGVPVNTILKVLHDSETETLPIRKAVNGLSQKFRSEKYEIEVTVNPDTGILIQVNPWKRGDKK